MELTICLFETRRGCVKLLRSTEVEGVSMRRPKINLLAAISGFAVLVMFLEPSPASAATAPGSSPANPVVVPFHESTPVPSWPHSPPGPRSSRGRPRAPRRYRSGARSPPRRRHRSGQVSDHGSTGDCTSVVPRTPTNKSSFMAASATRPSKPAITNGTWQPDADSCTGSQGGPSTWAWMGLVHRCPGSNPWWYHSWGDVDVLYQGVWSLIGPAQSPAIFGYC